MSYQAFIALANYFDIPMYPFDLPNEENEENLKYVVDQFGEIIEWIEHMAPDAKYNEDILAEEMERGDDFFKYHYEIFDILHVKPCPATSMDLFRAPRGLFWYPYRLWDRVIEQARLYRDEVFTEMPVANGVLKKDNYGRFYEGGWEKYHEQKQSI